MASASLIAVILPLGRQATATLFVSEYLAHLRHGLIRGYVRNGHVLIWRMSAVSVVMACFLAFAWSGSTVGETVLAAGFALAMAPALAFISFNGGVLTGAQRQFSAMLPESLLKPSFVLLAVLVSVVALERQATVLLLGIVCAGIWITAGFQAWLMYSTPVADGAGEVGDETGRWRATGWPWIFISLIWDYFIELHLLLAGLIATTGEVAVLHICFRLRVLAGFGTRALYALVIPNLFEANATGNERELRASLTRANALALAYAIAVCAGVWLVGEFVLGIVDDSFRSAHPALIVMCLTIVVRAVFGPATAVLSMKGFQLPSLWTLIAGLVISIALSLALMPSLGVLGIALAYLIANSAIAVCQWHVAWRLTGIDCSIFAGFGRGRAPVAETEGVVMEGRAIGG